MRKSFKCTDTLQDLSHTGHVLHFLSTEPHTREANKGVSFNSNCINL